MPAALTALAALCCVMPHSSMGVGFTYFTVALGCFGAAAGVALCGALLYWLGRREERKR